MNEHNGCDKPLHFWQQNINKSLLSQLDLLNNTDPKLFNFIFLQEPHVDFLNLSRANHQWMVIYPTCHHANPKTTRSVTLVSTRVSKNKWKQVHVQSNNVTAVELSSDFGTITFYNIYNACENADTLHTLQDFWMYTHPPHQNKTSKTVWLGDFNRHHPLWDNPSNTHLFTAPNLNAASPLVDLLGTFSMEMPLPAGIPTIETFRTGSLSRPDNVFCSTSLLEAFIECNTKPELHPAHTDHFPITGTIDLSLDCNAPTLQCNWKCVEWDDFRTALHENLQVMGPACPIQDKEDFLVVFNLLTAAIQSATDQHVPETKPSPYAKRWWSSELMQLCRHKCCLKSKSYHLRAQRFHPVHEEAKKAANEYATKIEKAKKKHWEDWLEDVNTDNVWTAHKYAGGAPMDGGNTQIPTLKTQEDGQPKELDDNEEKSKALYETFFPRPPTNPSTDLPTDYPDPTCEFNPITDNQVHRAIKRLAPFKALRPNSVCSIVFIKCADQLVPWMGNLFRATFSLSFFPDEWLTSKTVVIQKPSHPDYSAPKAYRPIALLDTMSKILSTCIAEDIAWIANKHSLLPTTHFGGLPGCATTDSLHLIMKFIHDAWAHLTDHHISILFLYVKAAFPSVVPERLFHNMQKQGIPKQYTNWYRICLTG